MTDEDEIIVVSKFVPTSLPPPFPFPTPEFNGNELKLGEDMLAEL